MFSWLVGCIRGRTLRMKIEMGDIEGRLQCIVQVRRAMPAR
jgi:hypothetical protein